MICNYTSLLHPAISRLIVDHNSVKRNSKVINWIVLSAEYWCPNSTCNSYSQKYAASKRSCLTLYMVSSLIHFSERISPHWISVDY